MQKRGISRCNFLEGILHFGVIRGCKKHSKHITCFSYPVFNPQICLHRHLITLLCNWILLIFFLCNYLTFYQILFILCSWGLVPMCKMIHFFVKCIILYFHITSIIYCFFLLEFPILHKPHHILPLSQCHSICHRKPYCHRSPHRMSLRDSITIQHFLHR